MIEQMKHNRELIKRVQLKIDFTKLATIAQEERKKQVSDYLIE